MSLFSLEEVRQLSPLFHGRVGGALARKMMRLLSIDAMNALYERHSHLRGASFAHSVLADLGVIYEVYADNPSVVATLEDFGRCPPFITISNHPYGGIDGLILADLFGNLCPRYKLMVNQILGKVEALSSSFIPVTPMGDAHVAPTSASILGVRHALEHIYSGGALGLFPSGAVSDFSLLHRLVADREWQLSVVRLIARVRVPVIPVHFLDKNSWFYYTLGLIDWRVRLLRLPAELFNKSGSSVRLVIGDAISVEEQQKFLATHTIEEFGMWLRGRVYGMSLKV